MSDDLFNQSPVNQPLAARMRPQNLTEFVGQDQLLAPGKPLRLAIERDQLYSMILWGPPGTGKTTLARLMANYSQAYFVTLSAVSAGVKEIREVAQQARLRQTNGNKTLVFVDEVHRFNKAQQDAFLPWIEEGVFIFVGATTENPSFELNNALLSRARVHVLRSLTDNEIGQVLKQALGSERGFAQFDLQVSDQALNLLIQAADGDARRALNLLDIAIELTQSQSKEVLTIEPAMIEDLLTESTRRADRMGDIFYDLISALHKSVRGSAPDAALYWFCRMLDAGIDPLYIARRIVRMASEDIGNADPRALTLALEAWQVFERLGAPEGELALAQAILYLATAPKSNAVYQAFNAAKAHVSQTGQLAVPMHLRNAPTRLMKDLGFSKNYRYAHDEPQGYAAGENYLPSTLGVVHYYFPVERGLEIKIKEKLAHLAQLDQQANSSADDKL